MARRHGVGLGSVAIRYVLDRPQVARSHRGATNARHLEATLQADALTLTDEDRGDIDAVLRASPGRRVMSTPSNAEKGGRHARIMRYELNQT